MLLEVKNLNIAFDTGRGPVQAVKNLSLHLDYGETLGIVGETGSGKSVTALSLLGLLPTAKIGGEIRFMPPPANRAALPAKPVSILEIAPDQLYKIRGAEIAMIFQEPMTSLNPVMRCGHQVMESVLLHQNCPANEARTVALGLFEKVRITEPNRIFNAYPHELSGGQKQRVMIAMAMAGKPCLLVADEPTTALDVTVQKSILDLMKALRQETGLSMLFISHDLGVIAEIADRVAVMSNGEIVETGITTQILNAPQHPYTKGLIACRPSMAVKLKRLPTAQPLSGATASTANAYTQQEITERRQALFHRSPLLELRGVSVRFPVRKNWLGHTKQWLEALQGLDFEVYPGEIFGIAGESGCGKTTLGRIVNRLIRQEKGSVWYRQRNLDTLPEADFRVVRREIQMVFQDPYSSLNPRMPIGQALLEPMRNYKLYGTDRNRKDKVVELLETVGMEAGHMDRFPSAFSGGQRQRICLARALTLQPKLLVCDEIVSALDVSVQATILNLLLDLREKFSLTYLFISHDLSVIRQMCDRLLIMNKGKIEAIGWPEELFDHPANDYVRGLIEALPGKNI